MATDTDEKHVLIQRLQEIAHALGSETVPRHEFLRRSGVSEHKIQSLFGSYNGLVEAAGLEPRTFPTSDAPTYSNDEMLEEVVLVLRRQGAKLTRVFFDQHSRISSSACERRFGGWLNTLVAALAKLDPETDTILISRIREYTNPATAASSRREPTPASATTGSNDSSELAPAVDQDERPFRDQQSALYGDFINFRGLQHAPTNELGVVFLFGIVCRELGYVVEIVKPGFPDCEAKRKVPGKACMWERVRIEFEFRSRSFRSHGHDPNQCDVVVCWEDDWPECPIEVLELRKEIKRLSPAVS